MTSDDIKRAIWLVKVNTIEWVAKAISWIRFGSLTERATDMVGNVQSEIEFIGRFGKMYGFWAYGSFHPDYPYQGQPAVFKKPEKVTYDWEC